MYQIISWNPTQKMNGCGFGIRLKPEFKEAVSKSDLSQEKVNNWIQRMGRMLLENHGYCVSDDDLVQCHIRIQFGEWGLEHIQVPGNACGLDIGNDTSFGTKYLAPHNVDNLRQASLLLSIFTWFANYIDNET